MAEREKETIVHTGGGGGSGATAAILAMILVILVVLFFVLGGPGLFSGGSTKDIKATVDVNTPSGN